MKDAPSRAVADPSSVAEYKRILQQVLENRPAGTRLRLAEGLGKNRSFISQIANPSYSVPIPARHIERIFEICHGCRRCVSLCNAFPTLFDLIDATKSGEIDGVAKEDFGKVVDQCYLCDICYMTKCPYVPPHPWNVDFPHVMLRAKAIKFRLGGSNFRDRMLTGTDRLGKLATIPVVVQVVNKANKTPAIRRAMQKVIGVHAERRLPPYATKRFARLAPASIRSKSVGNALHRLTQRRQP